MTDNNASEDRLTRVEVGLSSGQWNGMDPRRSDVIWLCAELRRLRVENADKDLQVAALRNCWERKQQDYLDLARKYAQPVEGAIEDNLTTEIVEAADYLQEHKSIGSKTAEAMAQLFYLAASRIHETEDELCRLRAENNELLAALTIAQSPAAVALANMQAENDRLRENKADLVSECVSHKDALVAELEAAIVESYTVQSEPGIQDLLRRAAAALARAAVTPATVRAALCALRTEIGRIKPMATSIVASDASRSYYRELRMAVIEMNKERAQ